MRRQLSGSSAALTRRSERVRARARSLALPLLALVVPWQAWWRSGFLATENLAESRVAEHPARRGPEVNSSLKADPSQMAQNATSLPATLRLAVFDLAGTTLDDLVDGQPIAIIAIRSAFQRAGYEVNVSDITAVRGLEKREAIRQICRNKGIQASAGSTESEEDLVNIIFTHFHSTLDEAIGQGPLHEIAGTSATFEALRARGISIVVGSGFEQEVVKSLVHRLGWKVDGLVAANRPEPDAVFEAMRIANVEDARQVVKIGDTVADIEEGRNAGVWTVAVLTGTQGEERLRSASPDFVLSSVADLPNLLSDAKFLTNPQAAGKSNIAT